ncbi:O-antigen ligase family protein [Vibrio sp. WJH972]
MTKIINSISPNQWQALALFSLLGYVLTAFSLPSMHHFFSVLVVIGSLVTLKLHFRFLIKEPIFIVFLLVVAVQIISWFLGLSVLGDMSASQPKIDKLARLFLFIPLAFWLNGKSHKIYWLWGGYFLAILLACFQSPTVSADLINLTKGIRVDFGIKNAMYTSVFSGLCCLVAIIFFTTEILKSNRNTFCMLGYLVIILLSAIILIGSQSRQVFVAYAVILILAPIFVLICFEKARRFKTKVLLSYLLIPVIIIALFQQNAIKSRFEQESSTILSILSGDFEHVPLDSAGIRARSWLEASKSIEQYPLFGLGPKAPKFIIQSSELFKSNPINETIKGLQHFHNSHVDILASYGLIGWLLIISCYFMVLVQLYKLRHTIPNGESWLFIGMSIITFWLIVNAFESYNLRSYGVITHNIFMASFLSFYFNYKIDNFRREN